jgi:phosphohistidine phosphatase
MKTIYLARHAKSSWNSLAATDFDRPISNRGEEDARRIGEEMHRLGWVPDKIIASPAVRARQTCKILCKTLAYPVEEVEWNSEIYAAYMVTLLHLLASLDDEINSVMLIGHNPAMEDLLVHLCGYAAINEVKQKDGKIFTTANIAKLTTSVEWKNLVMDEARLERLLRPKEI